MLKLITDRNLFSPAMPSAFIFSSLRRGGEIFCYSLYSLGKWIMMVATLYRVKPKKKRYRCQTSQSFNEKFSTYSLYAAGRFQRLHVNRVQSVWNSRGRKRKRDWKKKTARVRGFVLCVNGADAGVVLFI